MLVMKWMLPPCTSGVQPFSTSRILVPAGDSSRRGSENRKPGSPPPACRSTARRFWICCVSIIHCVALGLAAGVHLCVASFTP